MRQLFANAAIAASRVLGELGLVGPRGVALDLRQHLVPAHRRDLLRGGFSLREPSQRRLTQSVRHAPLRQSRSPGSLADQLGDRLESPTVSTQRDSSGELMSILDIQT